MDGRGRIIQFSEKPKGADLKAMVSISLAQKPVLHSFCLLQDDCLSYFLLEMKKEKEEEILLKEISTMREENLFENAYIPVQN